MTRYIKLGVENQLLCQDATTTNSVYPQKVRSEEGKCTHFMPLPHRRYREAVSDRPPAQDKNS